MNKDVIGGNAGAIWASLTAANNQTFKSLKKATKLKDKDLYMALGWLAREDKVKFDDSEEEVIVTLL